MDQYRLSYKEAQRHFLKVEAVFDTSDRETTIIKLPAWRPGRYELGDFAKNVKDFIIKDGKGRELNWAKRKKNEWFVDTKGVDSIQISYLYYANELNAGATFLSKEQLYVNPVNCLVYIEFCENNRSSIEVVVPDSYEVATSLKRLSKFVFEAESFHELVDSPIIASDQLQHKIYKSNGVEFYVWFQGEIVPQWDRLIEDFQKFTDYQIEKFGDFPVNEYHFLFQIDIKKAYHGVEHQKSTVLYLGPSYKVFRDYYTELLGVCSHELYHTWNVKAVRPVEMFPYDYSEENFTRLGYVAEGVTTYMGDRILFECGVFSEEQYHKEFGNYITRHFHNDGRKHYSVSESSFDTWLDGYVKGVPGRKVSIYVEGCLIAYICDMRIRKESAGAKSLHTAMRRLYELTNQKLGYSEEVYREILEAEAGVSFADVFDGLVNGMEDFTPYLEEALVYEGRELEVNDAKSVDYQYGLKGVVKNGAYEVAQVLEGSAADLSGLVEGDLIHAINGIALDGDFSSWLEYFDESDVNVQIKREGVLKSLKLVEINTIRFKKYSVVRKG